MRNSNGSAPLPVNGLRRCREKGNPRISTTIKAIVEVIKVNSLAAWSFQAYFFTQPRRYFAWALRTTRPRRNRHHGWNDY